MAPAPVTIVGAGIAGLTTALALHGIGVESAVIEKRAVPAATGAGIQLSANAVHVLDDLGLGDQIRQIAIRPSYIQISDGLSGRALTRFALGNAYEHRYGAPYLVVHRRDLQSLLLDACDAKGITPLFDVAAIDIVEKPQTVELTLADGKTMRATAVIGADGVRSAIREAMAHGASPRFSGYVAWRMIAPTNQLPEALQSDDVGLWLLPDAHLVHYPVSGGCDTNLVTVLPWRGAAPSGWVDAGSMPDAEGALPGAHPALREVFSLSKAWGGWPLYATQEMLLSDRSRLCLVGDAAHPMLPYAAQGGAMAIEDAATLAQLIRGEKSDIPSAIERYQWVRKRRVDRVMALARQNGRLYHCTGITRRMRNLMLSSAPQFLVQRKLRWLYGWKPPDRINGESG